MPDLIDLHLHSTCSDGSSSPTEVVERAADQGLAVISLTDHDSVGGVAEAQSVGKEKGVHVIPGSEFSAKLGGWDIHILGYFLDTENDWLVESLALYRDERRNRAERIVGRLNRLGIRVMFEQVLAKANGAAIGRPHIADVLVEEGFCFSPNEAFHKYLGYGKVAYEEKYVTEPSEIANVIHEAGGLAVIAHPVLYRDDSVLPKLVEQGVDGIEVWHIKHRPEDVRRYAAFADENGLLKSGGSDCHGDGRGDPVIGKVEVPVAVYEELSAAHNAREYRVGQ